MEKPERLKRVLLRAVPGLKAAPERLSIFVDKGRIGATAGADLSFRYHYTLNVVVQDYSGDVDALMVPVLAWLAEEQPDLFLGDKREPFSFDAELLEQGAHDVSIDIELSESVRIVAREGGGFDATHLPEPSAAADCFEGAGCPLLWQLFLQETLLAQTSDPAFVPPA